MMDAILIFLAFVSIYCKAGNFLMKIMQAPLSVADWVNSICAVLSLVATILIGVWQIRQSSRMDKLEQRQADREKKRYEETIEIEANRFISKYAGCIGLLPLCAIAVAYNRNHPYIREMYSEFRFLSRDVRLKIFKCCGWTMCDVETDDFYNDCMKCLEKAFEQFLPKENFQLLFYDSGKYVKRAVLEYGKDAIPHLELAYEKIMKDILYIPFDNNEQCKYDSSVVNKVITDFNFASCSEIENCQIACYVAKHISMYSGEHLDAERSTSDEYGSPGSWAGERIETMEDLFLLVLYHIWLHLWTLKGESELTTVVAG